jgi:hypothetical protein
VGNAAAPRPARPRGPAGPEPGGAQPASRRGAASKPAAAPPRPAQRPTRDGDPRRPRRARGCAGRGSGHARSRVAAPAGEWCVSCGDYVKIFLRKTDLRIPVPRARAPTLLAVRPVTPPAAGLGCRKDSSLQVVGNLHLVAHSLSSIIGSSSALRRVTFVHARGFFLCLV